MESDADPRAVEGSPDLDRVCGRASESAVRMPLASAVVDMSWATASAFGDGATREGGLTGNAGSPNSIVPWNVRSKNPF